MSANAKANQKEKAAAKTAPAAAQPAAESAPKKITARDIIYSDDQIGAIGDKLDELIETLPVVKKAPRETKKTARVVVKGFYPKIKALMDKGYSRKYIHEVLTENKLIDVPIFTFLNALKACEKEAAEAAKQGELNMEIKGEAGKAIPDGDVSAEDLAQAQKDIDSFNSENEIIEKPVVVPA